MQGGFDSSKALMYGMFVDIDGPRRLKIERKVVGWGKHITGGQEKGRWLVGAGETMNRE